MPYDMPSTTDEDVVMPRGVIRIKMPAAAVTQIFDKRTQILRDPTPQDDSAIPTTHQ